MRKLLFGTSPEPTGTQEFAMLLLRVFTGLTMAFAHGLGKVPPPSQLIEGVSGLGFPLPGFFAWAAALAEFAGGLLLAMGLFTRPASLLLAMTMAVAAVLVHGADPFQKKEMALLYLFISLVFLLKGAGQWSVDRFLDKK